MTMTTASITIAQLFVFFESMMQKADAHIAVLAFCAISFCMPASSPSPVLAEHACHVDEITACAMRVASGAVDENQD